MGGGDYLVYNGGMPCDQCYDDREDLVTYGLGDDAGFGGDGLGVCLDCLKKEYPDEYEIHRKKGHFNTTNADAPYRHDAVPVTIPDNVVASDTKGGNAFADASSFTDRAFIFEDTPEYLLQEETSPFTDKVFTFEDTPEYLLEKNETTPTPHSDEENDDGGGRGDSDEGVTSPLTGRAINVFRFHADGGTTHNTVSICPGTFILATSGPIQMNTPTIERVHRATFHPTETPSPEFEALLQQNKVNKDRFSAIRREHAPGSATFVREMQAAKLRALEHFEAGLAKDGTIEMEEVD